MQKLLLLGDEAVAQGALDGGMSGIYAYPGTPSTEITEYVQENKYAKEKGIHRDWSANEKTAVESAIGMSYAGKRAMACMKHVGLNVAADAFVNSAITGANGGLVITVADDPSMHSSQNEQDSRFFGQFAQIPMFEPCDQQEAYDMAYKSFELSEKFRLPILMRIVTRLAHSRAGVERKEQKQQNEVKLPSDPRQFVLLPSIAKQSYKNLISIQDKLIHDSENSEFNKYIDANDKKLGIIVSGIAYNYLMENFEDRNVPHPVLKIGQYPLPKAHIEKMFKECDKIVILEEGYPIIEDQLAGFLCNEKILGRRSGTVPRDGELNPNIVAKALGLKQPELNALPENIKGRPPQFCDGCGHIDMYNALNEALSEYGTGRVLSDIGCYTMGALPPFSAINSCVDMGASITMAKGAADAGLVPSVAVIGDSTFTHSGMTGLLDAVIENTPIVVCIADNSFTAMTGGQKSHAEDKIDNIVKGIGVPPEHIRVLNPMKKHHEEMVNVLKEELAYKGVSVVIFRRVCITHYASMMKKKRAEKK
ncbi:MAG: indolepyruvate ferredoxin oxidoreductase [Bacteroidales bacterium]|nr:indolepyruvate ferredoxin oxidoreductase [Bacteroidales bacterium]